MFLKMGTGGSEESKFSPRLGRATLQANTECSVTTTSVDAPKQDGLREGKDVIWSKGRSTRPVVQGQSVKCLETRSFLPQTSVLKDPNAY